MYCSDDSTGKQTQPYFTCLLASWVADIKRVNKQTKNSKGGCYSVSGSGEGGWDLVIMATDDTIL